MFSNVVALLCKLDKNLYNTILYKTVQTLERLWVLFFKDLELIVGNPKSSVRKNWCEFPTENLSSTCSHLYIYVSTVC